MGFLDIISTVANVATGISSIFGGETVTPSTTTAGAAATVAAAGVKLLTGTATAAATGGVTGSIAGGVTGSGRVFTRTVIQRIDRADGSILSEEIKMGSPWLMRSEVAALKKVTNAIRAADKKIPRKNGHVTDKQLQKAVVEDIQQLSLIQNLIGHHGGHHNGHA